MKELRLFLVGVLASSSGFVVHVFSEEWLSEWVGDQVQGALLQPSWDVRYVAGFTSIEYGMAAIFLYYLTRDKLLKFGRFKSALIFAVLLAASHGALMRQPLMDFIIGNPLHVVFVQNMFKWLVWFLMAFITVFGFEIALSQWFSKNK